ncbi:MAG: OmpA family protein [Bacteroidetes bacterium]|nr:OmpA family protein [Bacteroidota bacterium]
MRILIIFGLLIANLSCSVAQMGYSTKDKKAIKIYEEAIQIPNQQMDPRTGGPNYVGGIDAMTKALDRDPDFWEAHLVIGEFYEYTRNYKKAIYHMQQALKVAPNHSATGATQYFLASLLKQEGDYDQSIVFLDQFLMFKNSNPDMRNNAIKMKGDCLFAKEALRNPTPFNPINIGPGINTKDPEYFPTITVDGRTILFTRRIKDDRVRGPIQEQEDFYVSNLNEANIWGQAIAMPNNINTINNEGAPTLAPDGQSLIFVACPDASGENYGENRTGKGSCDMFYTKRLGKKWTNPENLSGNVNSFNWESQPSLSADGKTLYFIRGIYRKDGSKSTDIYVSRLGLDGRWSTAERLPDIINTPFEEESVLIHPDGRTLYFASRGHQGMGGTDLFMSRMDDKGNWGRPVNLGYPINTKNNENSLMVSADGEIAFFASDRAGGFGDLDIYYFELPVHLRPIKTLFFEGKVFDAVTNMPVPGKFQLIDLESGNEVVISQADPVTGEFLVSLPTNKRYALNVSYPNYSFYSNTFDMVSEEGQKSVYQNVPMVPLSSTLPTVLNNVFFDLNKASLRPESFIELNKLVSFLQENGKVKIEIGGHTDTRGDDKENMILSTERAKSVYNYIIEKGIPASRLTFKGYGESSPIKSDIEIAKLTDAKQIELAHQKNRRTEYKILP